METLELHAPPRSVLNERVLEAIIAFRVGAAEALPAPLRDRV